jgi:hypothetical protein
MNNNIYINTWAIFPSYVNVMNEYLIHFTKTEKFKKGEDDAIYLLLNGFSTLTHVFKIMLRNTLDEAKAIENCRKALFYYTQCIEQMEESKMEDLNSSSSVASIFVYKKTIGDICATPTPPAAMEIIKNVEDLINIIKKRAELLIGQKYHESVPDELMRIALELCKGGDPPHPLGETPHTPHLG